MPGCRYFAIDSTAETMKDMSGSFVLRSGVGTQMFTVSAFARTEKSVVAERRPAARSAWMSAVATSAMYDVPSFKARVFRSSRSIPTAVNPARPSSTSSGRPT